MLKGRAKIAGSSTVQTNPDLSLQPAHRTQTRDPGGTTDGRLRKAKKRGVQFGKRPALTQTQMAELLSKRNQGALIRELMAEYGRSKATVYRYLQTAARSK